VKSSSRSLTRAPCDFWKAITEISVKTTERIREAIFLSDNFSGSQSRKIVTRREFSDSLIFRRISMIRNDVAAYAADNPLDQPIPFVAGLQSSSENLSPSPFHAAGEFSVRAHRRARTDRDIHTPRNCLNSRARIRHLIRKFGRDDPPDIPAKRGGRVRPRAGIFLSTATDIADDVCAFVSPLGSPKIPSRGLSGTTTSFKNRDPMRRRERSRRDDRECYNLRCGNFS